MNEQEIIERGAAADRICSEPVYQDAWKAVMDDLFKQWVESPIDDWKLRERLRLEVDVLTRLKGKFTSYMSEATLVRHHQDTTQ